MTSFRTWSSEQWLAAHQKIQEPSSDVVIRQVIEGSGVLEPSEWAVASPYISQWLQIVSLFIASAKSPTADIEALLLNLRPYKPEHPAISETIAFFVEQLYQNLELTPQSQRHWQMLVSFISEPHTGLDTGDWHL